MVDRCPTCNQIIPTVGGIVTPAWTTGDRARIRIAPESTVVIVAVLPDGRVLVRRDGDSVMKPVELHQDSLEPVGG